MLIALTIMVFLILVLVLFGFNDNSKNLGRINDTQNRMIKHLEQIEYNTRSIK